MKQDSRLSMVLHILLHLAEVEGPATSEQLARMGRTNPVVIRRILAGLRDRKLVQSEKGHGGGWRLSRDPGDVTLHDIYVGLDSPAILAIGNRTESQGCLVAETLNTELDQAYQEAERVLLARFRDLTLADLSQEVRRRAGSRGRGGESDPVLSRCPSNWMEDERV